MSRELEQLQKKSMDRTWHRVTSGVHSLGYSTGPSCLLLVLFIFYPYLPLPLKSWWLALLQDQGHNITAISGLCGQQMMPGSCRLSVPDLTMPANSYCLQGHTPSNPFFYLRLPGSWPCVSKSLSQSKLANVRSQLFCWQNGRKSMTTPPSLFLSIQCKTRCEYSVKILWEYICNLAQIITHLLYQLTKGREAPSSQF